MDKLKSGDIVVVLEGEGTTTLMENQIYIVNRIQCDKLAHGGQGITLFGLECCMYSSLRFKRKYNKKGE